MMRNHYSNHHRQVDIEMGLNYLCNNRMRLGRARGEFRTDSEHLPPNGDTPLDSCLTGGLCVCV